MRPRSTIRIFIRKRVVHPSSEAASEHASFYCIAYQCSEKKDNREKEGHLSSNTEDLANPLVFTSLAKGTSQFDY
jgi:hypothetical protein